MQTLRATSAGPRGHHRRAAAERAFSLGELRHVRRFVADLAREAGLGERRTDELEIRPREAGGTVVRVVTAR